MEFEKAAEVSASETFELKLPDKTPTPLCPFDWSNPWFTTRLVGLVHSVLPPLLFLLIPLKEETRNKRFNCLTSIITLEEFSSASQHWMVMVVNGGPVAQRGSQEQRRKAEPFARVGSYVRLCVKNVPTDVASNLCHPTRRISVAVLQHKEP